MQNIAIQIDVDDEVSARPSMSLAWLATGSVFLLAVFLRLLFLGRDGFWNGELFHVFAAKSLLEGGTFNVPMWGIYRDARPVTLAVAAAFRVFGESEWAARFPFALLSSAFLALSFSIVRRLTSFSVAFIFLVIVGLSPLCVEYSREVRVFGIHQMYFFIAATAFLIGFEDLWRTPNGSGLQSFRFDFRWLAVSGLFTFGAWMLHPLTVLLAIPLGVYFVVMAAGLWRRLGFRQGLLSRYVLGLFVLGLIAAAAARYSPARLEGLIRESTLIYDWQAQMGHGSGFYRHHLVEKYPALTFLLPVGLYSAIRHHGRRGLFLSVMFVPLALTLSFFVARKSERYLMCLFPFFAVIAAFAIAPLAIWARDSFNIHFGSRPVRRKLIALALFSPCALLFVHPWLETALGIPFHSVNADWKTIDRTFKNVVFDGTVITSNPREFIYYFHRNPDFYRTVEKNGGVYEPGLVPDAQAFHDTVVAQHNAYFIGSDWNFQNDAIMSSDMRNTVLYSMSPVDHGGDRRILSFHRD